MGYSPWGLKESDTTEQLHFHFSLSRFGEGNGNPFQCSCLKNPRDGGAWWAAVYGVTQSQTRLKRLSSSSSREHIMELCGQKEDQIPPTGHRFYAWVRKIPLEKGMATHSSVLA